MAVVFVVVVLAGWVVPLLLLVAELVVQGWRKADVWVLVSGAGAAGDAVLERFKPL